MEKDTNLWHVDLKASFCALETVMRHKYNNGVDKNVKNEWK